MKRWFLALLATTSLCGVNQARADLVWASQTGAFGQSFASPTALTGPSSTIYNDRDQYNSTRGADFFSVNTPYSTFTLLLTASRVASDGNGGYYSLDTIDSRIHGSSASSSEGSSSIVATALRTYGGAASITDPGANASSANQNNGISLLVTASGNSGSYTIPTATLDPILTFYDDSGNDLAIVEITDGNSVTLSGSITGLNDLNFSVSSPFDYNVQLDGVTTDIPEPASIALLGLGAAGAALARRRKRVI